MGDIAVVPLTGGGLASGAGPHECPGQAAAIAIATGIVEAVAGAGGVAADVPLYEDRWNLRIVDRQQLRRAR